MNQYVQSSQPHAIENLAQVSGVHGSKALTLSSLRVPLSQCLVEVTAGVGRQWHKYPVLGATRDGIAPAKESVGKKPERYKLVEPGTIFYNPMRILLGSIALVDEGDEPGITSPDYVVFRTRPEFLHHRWFYYWLRSPWGADFIKTLARGAVRERMLFRRLAVAEVDVPPVAAQRRFAEQVLAVERARTAAEAQLEAANAVPAACLRSMFRRVAEEAHENSRLGHFLRLRKDVVHPSDRPKGQAVFVGLEHIEPGTGRRTGKVDLLMEKLTGRKPRFRKGDIVYGYLRPYLNKVWVAEFDGLCSVDQYVYTVDRTKANVDFIAWFMRSPQYRERSPIGSASAQLPRIRVDEVAAVQVDLPDLGRQAQIVGALEERLDAVWGVCDATRSQLDAISKLPEALLRRALSGGF